MSKKVLKIKNLDGFRYKELKYICLQYGSMKEKIRGLSDIGIRSSIITGMPTSRSNANKVEENVIRKIRLEERVKAIEQAAMEADSDMYEEIIKNVTESIPPRYLYIKCSERKFYYLRRLFFDILDKKI